MPSSRERITRRALRRAILLAYVNAGLWAIGNGMVGTTLVLFLATSFGARGLALSLIIASPSFVGLLRLATPAVIGRVGDRRRCCVLAYTASSATLLLLPIVTASGVLPGAAWSIAALVILWGLYHLIEYVGTISLWSWLGDLVPAVVRGRFLGRRQSWLVAGNVLGIAASGVFTFQQTASLPQGHPDRWVAYVICVVTGAVFMLSAVVPLVAMPNVAGVVSHDQTLKLSWIVDVWRDRGYRRLMTYSCWFALVNGLTQAAQFIYPTRVLRFQYFEVLGLRSGLRLGQSAVSPYLGRLVDRLGNVRVMIPAQLLVAAALLFFVVATPTQRWWIAGAYAIWVAYAALNIGLPNLMLGLSPGTDDSRYIAVYLAADGLCYGLGTVAGGLLFDWLMELSYITPQDARATWVCTVLFVAGFFARAFGVVLLRRIPEPDKLT